MFHLEKFKDIIIILIIKKVILEKEFIDIYNYVFYIKFCNYITGLGE
jgi:hypothetical protein